jgi:chromodomain-helicase-DNA-binding protein 1
MDEDVLKEELRPVKKQLVSYIAGHDQTDSSNTPQKKLKLSGGDLPRDDKVAILKDSLAAIGQRIDVVLQNKAEEGEDLVRWRRHLWA